MVSVLIVNQKQIMNREIKFRAWLTNGEGVTYSNGSHMEYNITLVGGKYADVEAGWDIQGVSDYPVMQYTGLKDKNGIEIYEGDILDNGWQDIVQVKNGIAEIEDNEMYGSNQVSGFYLVDKSYETHIDLDKNVKVIGNIYENPELCQ